MDGTTPDRRGFAEQRVDWYHGEATQVAEVTTRDGWFTATHRTGSDPRKREWVDVNFHDVTLLQAQCHRLRSGAWAWEILTVSEGRGTRGTGSVVLFDVDPGTLLATVQRAVDVARERWPD